MFRADPSRGSCWAAWAAAAAGTAALAVLGNEGQPKQAPEAVVLVVRRLSRATHAETTDCGAQTQTWQARAPRGGLFGGGGVSHCRRCTALCVCASLAGGIRLWLLPLRSFFVIVPPPLRLSRLCSLHPCGGRYGGGTRIAGAATLGASGAASCGNIHGKSASADGAAGAAVAPDADGSYMGVGACSGGAYGFGMGIEAKARSVSPSKECDADGAVPATGADAVIGSAAAEGAAGGGPAGALEAQGMAAA